MTIECGIKALPKKVAYATNANEDEVAEADGFMGYARPSELSWEASLVTSSLVKVVAEDNRERAGVDVVLAESRLLERVSASERAIR